MKKKTHTKEFTDKFKLTMKCEVGPSLHLRGGGVYLCLFHVPKYLKSLLQKLFLPGKVKGC